MSIGIVATTKTPSRGLVPHKMGRNGKVTANMAQVANFANMISSRRLHVLAQWGRTGMTGGVPIGVPVRIHTSPNSAGVESLIITSRANSGTTHGYYEWTIAGAATSRRYFGGVNAGTPSPNEWLVDRHRMLIAGADLAGDTVYDLSFTVNTDMRVHYVIVYEIPRSHLSTVTDIVQDLDSFKVGAPIVDSDISNLTDMAWTMYKRQGPQHFSWANFSSGSASTQLGTTYANVLDAATTGWGANADGFWVTAYQKGRLTSDTVECVFWVRASAAGGGTGRIRLVNSTGVLATITGIGALGYYTATVTLDSTITSELVILEHSGSTAGTTVSTFAAGLYEYET